jgi:hypothetical protein
LRWGVISQIEISNGTEQREKQGRNIREYWGRAETMKCRGMESRGKMVEAVAVAVMRYTSFLIARRAL